MSTEVSLATLGWRSHFQSQVDVDSADMPARVMNVHRGRVEIVGEKGRTSVELHGHSAGMGLTVGDWLLADVGDALDDVFSDVVALAEQCRFTNCGHELEPGCAVQSAIMNGTLDAERLQRYRKLQSEDRRNTESIAQRRTRDKHFGKLIKSVLSEKNKRQGGR